MRTKILTRLAIFMIISAHLCLMVALWTAEGATLVGQLSGTAFMLFVDAVVILALAAELD